MKVTIISKTPLAAAPWEHYACLKKYTDLDVRLINSMSRYRDGRSFPTDLLWGKHKDNCIAHIRGADVLHIHNCVIPEMIHYIKGKPTLYQFHSTPRRGNVEAVKNWCQHCYTVDQPMQLKTYPEMNGLPNLIDPEVYEPVEKTNSKPVVVFAPTNSWPATSVGSKASKEVLRILEGFIGLIEVDNFNTVPYLENLERKKKADIIIDDVVNETFHRTSLEGSCFGLAVITSHINDGWVYSNLDFLYKKIKVLIEEPKLLKHYQGKSRQWILENWHPKNLVERYVDAYKRLQSNTP